ncbi:MAG: type II secretion system protein E [Methanomicrobiales archaeon]|nr:type II secretion system protein E [Methanomicrobiales archaeon]
MAMRLSFTLDSDVVEMIDIYAKKRSVKREKAILELIEAGIAHMEHGGIVDTKPKRSFEEFTQLHRELGEVRERVADLQNEMRLVHHIIENDVVNEARGTPYQAKRWWEIWKM